MKKSFLFSAIAMCMALVSCSSDDDLGNGGNGIDPTIQETIAANVKTYGKKSSTMTVFAGSKDISNTGRGCNVEGNLWPSVPEIPSQDEVNGVLEYIKNNPDANVDAPNYTYYYIQHVGGAHNRYSYTDNNGALHENEIDGTQSMELLMVKELDGTWIHVNNFNYGNCNNSVTGNAALMTNGFVDASTLDENGSTTVEQWRIYYWEGNYYLAFDYSRNRTDGPVDPDGIYDDWVVKIIPAQGEPSVTPEDPTPVVEEKKGEVEFDIHQQEHKDWNEIKTSVHIRDTADVRIFIPIPAEYQAVADDFDIRIGEEYTYVEELSDVKFNVGGVEYSIAVEINHKTDGIEILIAGAECKEALKAARGIYDDGLTFEIHSYVYPTVNKETIWSWLKNVKCAETSSERWPSAEQCITHTYGQVTSYFTEERVDYVKDPQ